MIAFSGPMLEFKSGNLIDLGNGNVAVEWPDSTTVLSVQPNGTFETRPRTAIGAWETAKKVGNKLVYKPDGKVYVLALMEGI